MDFTAARDYLAKRLNMPTDMSSRVISDTIPEQVRAHCFFSARVAEGHVLDRLRGVSDAYSRGDIDLATARLKFKEWYDREKPGQRHADGEKLTNIASTMRLNLIMRQNAAQAAAVGRYQVSRDPDIEERWPCWRYITGPNPRASHAYFDGRVFLKSDPVWQKIYPPWDFNCNCDVEDAELPDRGADEIRPENVPGVESGYAFDPSEAFKTFDASQFEIGDVREDVHERLLSFCQKNNATTIVAVKEIEGETRIAGIAEQSPAKKNEIKAKIDEWIAKIPRDAQGKSDVSGMKAESIDLGRMLETHRMNLGISSRDARIRLSIPGGQKFGIKHWLKNHEDTLNGDTVIDLLERSIWNNLVVPREEIDGTKRRLIFENKDKDGNVSTVLFELTEKQKGTPHWELVDTWNPSDEYMDRRQKK